MRRPGRKATTALIAAAVLVACAIAAVVVWNGRSAGPWDAQPEVFEVNRLPATARMVPVADLADALAGDDADSPWLLSLNGAWNFTWSASLAEAPADFMDPAVSVAGWDQVDVPHQWQLDGYGDDETGDIVYLNEAHPWQGYEEIAPPAIPTQGASIGSYRRDVTVPDAWGGRRTVLAFQGVKSAFTVWVNGVEVGYSEDSYAPAEFDVTDVVEPGVNTVAVQVHRWSDGSWLENQDQIDLSGIFRDVELYSTPTTYLDDHTVTSELHEDGSATVAVAVELEGAAADSTGLTATLYGPDGEQVETTTSSAGQVALDVAEPLLWSAETPHLYSLVYELRDANGEVTEMLGTRIGIREFAIRDGVMELNGMPLDIKGVNRGEMHPDVGQAMTEEIMRADLLAMRAANITAVRTSHYPAHPMLYQLADEIGMYVMDEANVESHELRPFPGNAPEWTAAVIDRVTTMYERDKNHASVLWWSLGNEAGPGDVFQQAADWLREVDPGRLVHYQDDSSVADIEGVFYPNVSDVRELALGTFDKPWMMTEYIMSMGNAGAGMAEYWEAMDTHPQMQGGFIWDWADQAIRLPLDGGVSALPVGDLDDSQTYLSIGGDWGDYPSDEGFSLNGLVNPDRVAQPELAAVADAYEPVRTDASAWSSGTVEVCNEHLFTDLAALDVRWERAVDGAVTDTGVLDWTLAPAECADLALDASALLADPSEGSVGTVTVTVALAEDATWEQAGHVVATEQIVLWDNGPMRGLGAEGDGSLVVAESGDRLEITGDQVDAVMVDGVLEALTLDGTQVLDGPLSLDLWRAPTQNDLMNGLADGAGKWRQATAKGPASVDVTRPDGATVVVTTTYSLNVAPNPTATVVVTFVASGHVQVDVTMEGSEATGELMAVGTSLTMPGSFEHVQWWGDGPHATWADRTGGATLGAWSSTVDEQLFPHVVPQAEGNHTSVRWMALTDATGEGAVITAVGEDVQAAALPASETAISEAAHPHQVERDGRVHVSVDAVQAGLGLSWGETPLPGFSLKADQKRSVSFVISALAAGEDPAQVLLDGK
ncbi:glycoside hydrolase family 2 TIM barrel-domain containing protein [Demequina sp.]|uniref:glycoside hydrolase family 2 TIM barrel-domain containing protein n=1 Tax=Demequina sp. TaxID=2050685 RepID=UPI003A841374